MYYNNVTDDSFLTFSLFASSLMLHLLRIKLYKVLIQSAINRQICYL